MHSSSLSPSFRRSFTSPASDSVQKMALRARELRSFRYLILESISSAYGSADSASAVARGRKRQLSIAAEGVGEEESLGGKNAYEVLGVSESCSFSEIKASFRRLAKETHPDVLSASLDDGSDAAATASRRFLQILAAYEILSDSKRRAHYDGYLLSQRTFVKKQPGPCSAIYTYESSSTIPKQSNVVEWLKWYRLTVNDIVAERRIATGSGYFYELETELYSAIHSAYYGPLIESVDFLPDCFEADERSACRTSEVLHLVSGRDLFGIVSLADRVRQISHDCYEKLTSSDSMISGIGEVASDSMLRSRHFCSQSTETYERTTKQDSDFQLDIYRDLELHIFGRMVAVATRSLKCKCLGLSEEEEDDHIHIYLTAEGDEDSLPTASSGSRTLLGTITGLRTSPEEGCCSVYDSNGVKSHVIMKHRTLLVKHMHWYQVQNEVSFCECRCSRARLPPSKYWLFEPRCNLHDIGGWYVETFGRDNKGKTTPSQRLLDNISQHSEKRLHPAIYLLALAYRTLDLEHAKMARWRVTDFIKPKFYSILKLWKDTFG